jgi:cell division protein FtsW (lipid II flippase)
MSSTRVDPRAYAAGPPEDDLAGPPRYIPPRKRGLFEKLKPEPLGTGRGTSPATGLGVGSGPDGGPRAGASGIGDSQTYQLDGGPQYTAVRYKAGLSRVQPIHTFAQNWEARSLGVVTLFLAGMMLVAMLSMPRVVALGPEAMWMVAGLAVLLGLAHIGMRVAAPERDPVAMSVVAMLLAMGILMVTRLEPVLVEVRPVPSAYEGIAVKQLIFTGISLLLFAVPAAWVVRRFGMVWTTRYKYALALLGIAVLAATTVWGSDLGQGTGARLWVKLPGLPDVQPSELVKVLLILSMAGMLHDNKYIATAPHLIRLSRLRIPVPQVRYLLPLSVMWGLSMAVLAWQRDLGGALLFFGVFLGMLFLGTSKGWYVAFGAVALMVAIWLLSAYTDALGTAASRAQTWVDPWPQGATWGFQSVQSMYSMAAGGMLGVGVGAGRPDHMPATHTDMMLPVIGEEIGWIGVVLVLSLYALLLHSGLRTALLLKDRAESLVAAGISLMFLLQAVLIAGGSTGMLVLTGVTLPFVSYGGSSLTMSGLMLGILLGLSGRARAEWTERAAHDAMHAPSEGVVVSETRVIPKNRYTTPGPSQASRQQTSPASAGPRPGEQRYIEEYDGPPLDLPGRTGDPAHDTPFEPMQTHGAHGRRPRPVHEDVPAEWDRPRHQYGPAPMPYSPAPVQGGRNQDGSVQGAAHEQRTIPVWGQDDILSPAPSRPQAQPGQYPPTYPPSPEAQAQAQPPYAQPQYDPGLHTGYPQPPPPQPSPDQGGGDAPEEFPGPARRIPPAHQMPEGEFTGEDDPADEEWD